jgi:hypothetical protein
MTVTDLSLLSFTAPKNITSDGRYFYIANRVEDTIKIIRVSVSDSSIVNNSWVTLTTTWPYNSFLTTDANYLYVTINNGAVQRYSLSNAALDTTFGTDGTLGGFAGPNGLLVHNNKLYVCNVGNGSVYVVDLTSPTGQTQLFDGIARANGVTIADNMLYIISGSADTAAIASYDLQTNSVASLNTFPAITTLGYCNAILCEGTHLYVQHHNNKIAKITISDGTFISEYATLSESIENIFLDVPSSKIYSALASSIYATTVVIPPPPSTPIYLGNAIVTSTGDFNLAATIMNSTRFPQGPHELVPRAYVDNYIANVISYYDNILDPNESVNAAGNKLSVLDRLAYLEAQLDRVYRALWNVNRNVSQIVTPQSGPIVPDYVAASSGNDELLAVPRPAPDSLSGFQ